MRFSHRIPDRTSNAWSRALETRRSAGARLLDLTDSNPTRTGWTVAAAAAWTDADARAEYAPDPRGAPAARGAVAAYYSDRGGTVDPDHVVLTAGTSEGYAHLFRLLAEPGEAVLVPRPSYPLFEPIARAEGVEPRSYRLAYDGRWHLDVDSLGERDARAVIVVQPNHPTGSMLDESEVASVTSWCERHGAALIVDEVFGDYRWPPSALRRVASGAAVEEAASGFPTLAGEARVPTFVLGGVSKACGLPQMKVSWIAASGPPAERDEALGRLEWLSDLFLSVAAPAQHRLPEWLAGRAAFQSRVRERISANLESLAAFERAHPEARSLDAEGGWSVALRLPARRSEEEWTRAALERDVVVHPGHFYDFEHEPVVVMSLVVEPRIWIVGLERIGALLSA